MLNSRLIYPAEVNFFDLTFTFIGAVGAFLVALMYQRFLWWPLHPIGCTTGSSWGIQMFLLSIFLGWLFKYIILKHGGLKAYRSVRLLFLGLILGEYVIGAIWIIVGLFGGLGMALNNGCIVGRASRTICNWCALHTLLNHHSL